MRQLNFDLKTLQARHREGAFSTRRDRSYVLDQAANLLHALGFRRLRATGLKRKHVNALVAEWQRRGLAVGTMKNRMSAIRWWAERVGRPGVVDTNAAHGIGERRYVTNEDRSAVLEPEKLARVTDAHVRMSLELQAAFGLRREEAIKFTPAYADRGDRVRIKASWAKGGRAREIPIRNEHQRAVLDAAHRPGRTPGWSARAGDRPLPGAPSHRGYAPSAGRYPPRPRGPASTAQPGALRTGERPAGRPRQRSKPARAETRPRRGSMRSTRARGRQGIAPPSRMRQCGRRSIRNGVSSKAAPRLHGRSLAASARRERGGGPPVGLAARARCR